MRSMSFAKLWYFLVKLDKHMFSVFHSLLPLPCLLRNKDVIDYYNFPQDSLPSNVTYCFHSFNKPENNRRKIENCSSLNQS